jgi:hypothetical protein
MKDASPGIRGPFRAFCLHEITIFEIASIIPLDAPTHHKGFWWETIFLTAPIDLSGCYLGPDVFFLLSGTVGFA